MFNTTKARQTPLSKTLITSLGAIALIFSAIGFTHDRYVLDDKHSITIENLHDKDNTVYQVNGKRFTWAQLSTEQQATLTKIENKLKSAEQALAINDANFDSLIKEIEQQAKEIEKEAKAIELATIKIDQQSVSFDDISRWSQQLADATRINEQALMEKSAAIHKLEQQLPKIDPQQIKRVEQHAEELEQAIIEIAATLK